jgi:hypothetical protein
LSSLSKEDDDEEYNHNLYTNEAQKERKSDTGAEMKFLDNDFKEDFILNSYSCGIFKVFHLAIADYKNKSDICLRIVCLDRSSRRVYKCITHEKWTFFVAFGSRRRDSRIVVEKYLIQHYGNKTSDLAAGGRKQKTRCKHLLQPVISQLEQTIISQPLVADVIKTSATQKHQVVTYLQVYKEIQTNVDEQTVSSDAPFS